MLREKYKQTLTIKEGVKIALDIFSKIQGDKFSINKFELCYIESDKAKLERLEGEEINKL